MKTFSSIAISQSNISNLFRYQLKEPQITKYLSLEEDADYNYDCLKRLTYEQYKFLNHLFIEKHYKKIAEVLVSVGIKWNSDYIDYKHFQRGDDN
jgi:hypothetical protein